MNPLTIPSSRTVPFLLAVFFLTACAKPISPPEDASLPSSQLVTEEKRLAWRQSIREQYTPGDPEPGPATQQLLVTLDESTEMETYLRLQEVLEDQAILHEDQLLTPVAKYIFSSPSNLEQISVDLTQFPKTLLGENQQDRILPDLAIKHFSFETARLLDLAWLPLEKIHSSPLLSPYQQDILIDKSINHINRVATATSDELDNAFAAITENEMTAFLQNLPNMMEEFVWSGNIRKTYDESDDYSLPDTGQNIDYRHLIQAMTILGDLADPQFLYLLSQLDDSNAATAQSLELDPRIRGRFLYAQHTHFGLILIGDRGPNTYGVDAAIVIDLGGNDLYTNNTGAPTYEMNGHNISKMTSPFGVIIDLNGDDQYISNRFASIGSGLLGIGLVLDLEGNDLYVGDQLTQGAALLGLGCLVDMSGNDTFVAQEVGQGAALFGGALLLDYQGNDLYSGAKFMQGFGGPSGLGQLLDMHGDDHYVTGGKQGSGYGTPNIYQGYGQGLGWGFRELAGGGIGILHDLAGDDLYQAGNFSQGTGYYFGLGLLADESGNDSYHGSRYCQGSAAHQAIGILTDRNGSDIYSGEIAANQGAAWDVSIAGLFEYSGNDIYIGAELALGGGEQNGIGVFFEADGQDIYITGASKALGFGGDLSYEDGRNARNLGVFVDMGADNDFYLDKTREDYDFIVEGDVGIFWDQ